MIEAGSETFSETQPTTLSRNSHKSYLAQQCCLEAVLNVYDLCGECSAADHSFRDSQCARAP